ncbi:hypothetical protein CCH79_00012671 [Gambusia affinis]|uniref:Uncharacterized protein n=1 Tax=Gambusia affinis TaxID=33528 RepID=A0A315V4F6_GAMAF|nr:hypothetical protein CCH79_00012671 [Gambusia affinis]
MTASFAVLGAELHLRRFSFNFVLIAFLLRFDQRERKRAGFRETAFQRVGSAEFVLGDDVEAAAEGGQIIRDEVKNKMEKGEGPPPDIADIAAPPYPDPPLDSSVVINQPTPVYQPVNQPHAQQYQQPVDQQYPQPHAQQYQQPKSSITFKSPNLTNNFSGIPPCSTQALILSLALDKLGVTVYFCFFNERNQKNQWTYLIFYALQSYLFYFFDR